MKNLIFFNYWHNGDIHVSREFVKDILNKTNFNNRIYYHHNSLKLLMDINVEIKRFDMNMNINNEKLFYEDDNNVYVNTWFHLEHGFKYYQCTLEALYYNFTEIYKQLDIKLEDISFYIPKIDFSKFNVLSIDKFFKNTHFKKHVYICNGMTLSGQSDNMILTNLIKELSDKYIECLFILTEKIPLITKNITFSQDIIGSNGKNDLIENSYLSTKCDIIVGRTSGPSTFSIVPENVTNDNIQNILHLSHYKPFLDEKYYNKNKKLYCTERSSDMVYYINKIMESYEPNIL